MQRNNPVPPTSVFGGKPVSGKPLLKQNSARPMASGKPEPFTDYKLRVPRNLVKRYNVMKINSPRPIKLENIKEANMVRKTKKQVYVEEDEPNLPTHGAGSVYNYERKEEARKKRRGYVTKYINSEDLPYALRLDGKGGKRFTGRKEPILDHSAYYILTQCPDGVFEAVPVQAWYNFMPDIDYSTLTSDEVEHEFSKRDRTLSYFTKKYNLSGASVEEDSMFTESKVKQKNDGVGLVIHDDVANEEADEFDDPPSDSEKDKKKKAPAKKGKNIYRGKKKKNVGEDDDITQDSDEEEDWDNIESKEVDYMSESSSEDEAMEMDDEPDPEKNTSEKAKDELNIFSDSESDSEDDQQLNDAGKELKAILKKESGVGSSDEDEEEDEDIDKEYSKSAIFIQDGKKKKGKAGSNSGSKPTSRSSTPVQMQDQTSDTLNQAAKSLKESGLKRSHESSSPSPNSKKQKLIASNASSSSHHKRSGSPLTVVSGTGGGSERSASPVVRSGTPSSGHHVITEEAIRRYLSHKPMTTVDIMKKFKSKKTGLTKEQTVQMIADLLKKINPNQEKKDGILYLSLKPKKN